MLLFIHIYLSWYIHIESRNMPRILFVKAVGISYFCDNKIMGELRQKWRQLVVRSNWFGSRIRHRISLTEAQQE